MVKLFNGNNIDVLKTFDDNSIDSVVTDPPYGLGKEPDARLMLQSWLEFDYMEVKGGGFMGKKWDAFVPQPLFWKEIFRVLKPGGHVLSFYGTRTYDWGVMAMRLAGFEIRDTISFIYSQNECMQNLYETLSIEQRELLEKALGNDSMLGWVFGSGFPKSLNIGKSIDSMLGNEREKTGLLKKHAQKGVAIAEERGAIGGGAFGQSKIEEITKGNTEWEGWGTALKPALEPIVLARKPISEKNIAKNVLRWRTGGINIDECRVETEENGVRIRKAGSEFGQNSNWNKHKNVDTVYDASKGRFPANVIIDGSEEVVAGFPMTESGGGDKLAKNGSLLFFKNPKQDVANYDGSYGSASRFFYTAKAHSSERNYGLEGFELVEMQIGDERPSGGSWERRTGQKTQPRQNHHPTVKPLGLMQYLVRLITPKGGVCMDCFMGSGTTGMACKLEKFDFIGIELEKEYFDIAKARIDAVGEVTEIKLTKGRLF